MEVAILEKLQEGRSALFQQDGGAMLTAIVLDRPLAEAQALVDQPRQFLQKIKQVLDDRKRIPFWSKCYEAYKGTLRRKPQAVPVAKDASSTEMTTNSSNQYHKKLRPPGGAPGWSFLLKYKREQGGLGGWGFVFSLILICPLPLYCLVGVLARGSY